MALGQAKLIRKTFAERSNVKKCNPSLNAFGPRGPANTRFLPQVVPPLTSLSPPATASPLPRGRHGHLRRCRRLVAFPRQPPSNKALRVVVKGRVQGVGFRDWTAEMAESLGLAGWVRNNRRDGTVEALLSGEPAKVDDMVTRRLPVGPPAAAAAVTAVVTSPADHIHPSLGFEIKLTV